MALVASNVAFLKLPVKLFRDSSCYARRCFGLKQPRIARSLRVSMLGCDESNVVRKQLAIMGEKLGEAIPSSVKAFPWKKAEDILVQRLVVLAKVAAKWSLISLFILCLLTDVTYSILKNHELMIPVGLFIGCCVSEFFKEILQELFNSTKQIGLNFCLWGGLSCFFVFLKIISARFAIPSQVFLLHFANGGLLQVIWYWRSFLTEAKSGGERNSHSGFQAPT